MKLFLTIIFFGWWLARQPWISRGETVSKPSISMNPTGMVALGGNITIFCRSENILHKYFYLTRHEDSVEGTTQSSHATTSNKAAFLLYNLSQSDGGIYSCRTCLSEVHECSPLSDKISLNLTDPILTKPSIQIINEEEDAPEAYVSIRCKGTKQNLVFALLKSREQIDYRAAGPEEKAVDFFLPWMRLEKAQRYTCQYHHESHPFVWSEPSDLLELPWGVILSTETCIRLGLAGLVLFALMLIICFVHFDPFSKF